MTVKSLDCLKQGEKATVRKLMTKGAMHRRFTDIGIVEGTEIECVCISPSGDPKAFLIRGAVIAIRNSDSKSIIIE